MNLLLTLTSATFLLNKYFRLKLLLFWMILIAYTNSANGQCSFEMTPKMYSENNTFKKIITQPNSEFTLLFTSYNKGINEPDSDTPYFNFIHFDSCKNILWNNSINLATQDFGLITEVLQTPDQGFIMLSNSNLTLNPIVIKLNQFGNIEWYKSLLKDTPTFCYQMKPVFNESGFIISGEIRLSLSDGSIARRPYLIKIDEFGNILFEKSIVLTEDSNNILFSIIATLPDSSILGALYSSFFSSARLIKLDNRFNTLLVQKSTAEDYHRFFLGYSFVFDSLNNRILSLTRCTPKSTSQSTDILVSIDFDGNLTILRDIPFQPTTSYARMITPTPDGGLILGLPLIKLDAAHQLQWQKSLDESIKISDIAQLNDSSYVLFGGKDSSNDIFYAWPYIQKTNKQGWLVGEYELLEVKSNPAIYPNPANQELFISEAIGATAHLLNLNGQTVLSSLLKEESLDISQIQNGFYFLIIQKANGEYQYHKLQILHE